MLSKLNEDSDLMFEDELWTAPELLKVNKKPKRGSKEGDVFSYGIIVQEIILQGLPYCLNTPLLMADDIIKEVESGREPPYRPVLGNCKFAFSQHRL